MHTLTLKRGDTLSVIVARKDEDGNPLTGQAEKLRSQIRTTTDKLVAEFTISETSTAGEYLFEVPSSVTQDFPLLTLSFDVEFKDLDGYTKSSDTMFIIVIKDVTRP